MTMTLAESPSEHYRVQFPLPESPPDPLGIWETLPRAFAHSLDAPPDEPLVWRVELPSHPHTAMASLIRQRTLLAAATRGLVQADRRLEQFLHEARGLAGGRALAFDSIELPQLGPERELASDLELLHEAHSFSLGNRWRRLMEAGRQCTAFFQQVAYTLTHPERVETWYGGACLGRTEVTWLGNAYTNWRVRTDHSQVALHWRALRLSLASCQAWVRLTGHVLEGAGRISVLLALPGEAVRAIPAVWLFVTRIVNDVKQIATVNIEVGHAG
jgi:hypothetical protein